MSRTIRRASAVVLAVSSSVLVAVPAFADSSDPGVEGNDPATMSVATAVVIFGLIPISVGLIVWLLVSAPGWTRGGRPGQDDAWTGEPHVVGSGDDHAPASVVAGDGITEIEPGTAGDDTGGTSASW